MQPKVTYAVWLLAIFINQVMCQEKAGSDSHGAGSGGGAGAGAGSHGAGAGSHGAGAGSHGAGAGSHGAGAGGAGAGSGGAGGSVTMGGSTAGTQMFSMGGMGGMNGMQLPFPFFPPFVCDVECLPYQMQVVQQQVPQPAPKTTTHPPTTHPPPTTMKPVVTTQPHKSVAPTTSYFTETTYMMYPNWCQGWCRFFYKPQPPVYYQPNCLLFSWMGMGMGMQGMHGSMGM